jgi:hypothetical protein
MPRAYLPTCVTEAKYLIDLALLRAHSMFGVTACGKIVLRSKNSSLFIFVS